MKAVPDHLIRARAFEIWEQSGRPVGLEKQLWEQAEGEFRDAAALLAGAKGLGLRLGEESPSGIKTRNDEKR